MMNPVARRYAEGVMEAAAESKIEDQVLEQLEDFWALLREHDDLSRVLANPALALSSKRMIVNGLSEGLGLNPLVTNTLQVLLRNGRIGVFDQVVAASRRLRDEQLGIVRAEAYSVRPLPDSLAERLELGVSKLVGRSVRFTWSRDESLIGGLKIKIESLVLDGSIRARLDAVRKAAAG